MISHHTLSVFRYPKVIALSIALFLSIVGCIQMGIGWADLRVAVLAPAANTAGQSARPPLPSHLQIQPVHPTVDCAQTACLALTFDDGPNPLTTTVILDALERHHARASFFVVGSRVPGQEQLVRRMFNEGHEIGNHSWSHGDFTRMSPAQIQGEINDTQTAIVRAGVPAPTLFRPPYGAINATVRSNVPLTLALWNIDPLDWKARNVDEFKALLLQQARPGGVLDLHDIYGITAHALGPAIGELQKHYTLVTFSELMNLQPGQPGEFYGR